MESFLGMLRAGSCERQAVRDLAVIEHLAIPQHLVVGTALWEWSFIGWDGRAKSFLSHCSMLFNVLGELLVLSFWIESFLYISSTL
jgi:hypothetical protein